MGKGQRAAKVAFRQSETKFPLDNMKLDFL